MREAIALLHGSQCASRHGVWADSNAGRYRVWTTHGSSGGPFTWRGARDVGNVEA